MKSPFPTKPRFAGEAAQTPASIESNATYDCNSPRKSGTLPLLDPSSLPQPSVLTRQSRRTFLARLGAFTVAPSIALDRTDPEMILYNANVLTIDERRPRAQAMAIADGRFLAVGSNEKVRGLATARTKKIDLAGRTVVPGFIDAHSHPAVAGRMHLRQVDCDLRSIRAIQAAIRERAAITPAGQWVLGFKYDDTKTSEGRPLTRADLDEAAPEHPVYISHRGGHTAYANSLAFRIAEIVEETPDPAGGRFDRDSTSGKHNGRISERATDAFDKIIPENYSRADYREGVKLISQRLSRAGITSVHDAYGSHDDLRAYQDARAAGELSVRVYCLIGYSEIDRMIAAGLRTGFGDEWVRVGAMKMTCDGSISERTARLSEPYVGRPQDFGIQVMSEEQMYDYAHKAHEADWQIGIHANGDVAIDAVLRLYERLQREHPRRDPRFRLEHCTVVNDALVERIRALGAIPTPFAAYVYYHGEKMREYGAERLNHMFALRSFLDAGVHVAPGSDYPPGPFEPMMMLQSAVTRTDLHGNVWGARQRITAEEALRVGTLNGAYASFEDHLKGSIQRGKLADLVVLGRDPLREDPATLTTIPVEKTMVGGRWVFET
ncbi:MAG: amidohydrolase [Chthoniobacterales bacterium]|nr:amidohydrolase [Chthoniobacterales bacterium]